MSSADNQQERLKAIGWIVGFVDGEGCFSISLHKNKTMRLGWQVQPEFVVTQGERSLASLELLENFFDCGNIFINKRYDNHKEHLYRYCVRNFMDLTKVIIPFFQEHKLQTSKKESFEKFVQIIEKMKQKEHLTMKGLTKIAHIAKTFNHRKKPKFLESPEAIRQAHEVE